MTSVLLIFVSCKKENLLDCFKPTGSSITQVRPTGSFHTIKINNKINAFIQNGPEYRVELVAGKNVIKNVATSVADGILNVENNNTCNFVRGYKKTIQVNITVPYIKLVFNDGVGTIRFADDFKQDTLLIRAGSSGDIFINGNYNQIRTSSHGNGDIYINGTSKSLYVYANGTNFLNAGNLKVSDYVFIENLSIGDCIFDGSNLTKFEYNIHNDGNIYYTGKPTVINDYSTYTRKGRAIER